MLAGRALTNYMHPFTPQELGANFDLKKTLTYGLLPSATTEVNPKLYLESYVSTYLTEEVQQEGLTRNIAAFSRFSEVVTFSQAEVLTMSQVAGECMVSAKVVQDYFTMVAQTMKCHHPE